MARNIELYKIGETYIKFDLEFSVHNRKNVTEVYLSQVRSISSEYLKNEVGYKISIEYDKGSLKTRIIVWSTAIYLGIANYGSFRAGIREIINDNRQFSQAIISRIDDSPAIDGDDIIRSEKRSALPGRLQELYRRIDAYEANLNQLSNVQQQKELAGIKTEVASLIELLSQQDMQAFLQDLDNNYSQNLPDPSQRRTDYLISRYALKPEDEVQFIGE